MPSVRNVSEESAPEKSVQDDLTTKKIIKEKQFIKQIGKF
ncbi:hypothetical protein RintRC_5877 [Richelia intracellularis]|nr:hypothetical protein RintRC_5877 [Richelia intracellularis]